MTYFKHLEKADQETVLHPFTHLREFADGKITPRIITGGKGIHLTDQHNNTVIDGLSGLYCMNVGYGREEIADAIHEQARKLAYCHVYYAQSHEPLIRLSEKVIEMGPDNMERVFYGTSGSDANETQVKLVWYYHNVIGKPNKKKIIARDRAYHGGTVITGSLTGLPAYHELFDQPYGPILRTGAPHYYWGAEEGESELDFSKRRAQELEELILKEDPDTIGAFIAEPALGSGGLVPPPEGYWKEIQAVLKKYDILLIADEVVTAFGRTGEKFGSLKYGIEPDLISVAKALTSAYIPFSGAIVSKKVAEVLRQGSDKVGMFSHGYTYTGHALGAAAGLAVLDIIEKENLVANARDTGDYLIGKLKEKFSDHPMVGEVRGVGLMGAVEFVANKDRKERFDPALKVGARIVAEALSNNLIVRAMPNSDAIGFAPPLILTRSDADEIVDRFDKAVKKVTDDLSRENIWKAA